MDTRRQSGLILTLLVCLALAMAAAAQDQPPAPETPASTASTSPANEDVLVFGMTPVVGVESTLNRFAPLAKLLGDRLELEVRLEVPATYAELVEQVRDGKLDLVKLSPLAYVKAREQVPGLRLLATQVANGSTDYSSYLVALQDNPHANLEGLSGARLCFADQGSTSGYLFPKAWLEKQGKQPKKVTFGGNHRVCLEGLFEGRWDVAATWAGAIRDARQAGSDVGEIKIVAKTGRIPYDAWCASPRMSAERAAQLKQVLLDTNTMEQDGRRALAHTLGINGWIQVDDQVYDGVREVFEAHRPAGDTHQEH